MCANLRHINTATTQYLCTLLGLLLTVNPFGLKTYIFIAVPCRAVVHSGR